MFVWKPANPGFELYRMKSNWSSSNDGMYQSLLPPLTNWSAYFEAFWVVVSFGRAAMTASVLA